VSAVTAMREAMLSTNAGYRTYMGLRWGVGGRELPQYSWMNTALQNRAQVEQATAETARLKLPSCPDATKNWDTLAALREVLERTTPRAKVLDAGAEMYSRFLPWLYLYGYRDLCGNNLVFRDIRRRGPIMYEPGDITKTRFEDDTFDAVSCLSVVEHGVDLRAYFREMARILKPGGVLVTSTDYFDTPTDTRGLSAYGVPIHIFTRSEIEDAVRIADSVGLRLTGPLKLDCDQRVVRWDMYGLEYSFVVIAMTKKE
jgi:SAM-dependent methyltransferase